ncbi:MAG: YraN family protein [Thermosynechococcaceae cyanobacterium]
MARSCSFLGQMLYSGLESCLYRLMPPQNKKEQLAIGYLGEQLVAHWLKQNGWHLAAQGWHSRWGELDIVARQETGEGLLAFVEVKTRSRGNWDIDGLLAITAAKQAKLWKTARVFLAQHPQWAELPCRFDVALVQCVRSPQLRPKPLENVDSSVPDNQMQSLQLHNRPTPTIPLDLAIGQPIKMNDYTLTLTTYLEAAFCG